MNQLSASGRQVWDGHPTLAWLGSSFRVCSRASRKLCRSGIAFFLYRSPKLLPNLPPIACAGSSTRTTSWTLPGSGPAFRPCSTRMRISAGRQSSISNKSVTTAFSPRLPRNGKIDWCSTQAEESTGFLDALLNILEQEQDTAVRLSCAYTRHLFNMKREGAVSD